MYCCLLTLCGMRLILRGSLAFLNEPSCVCRYSHILATSSSVKPFTLCLIFCWNELTPTDKSTSVNPCRYISLRAILAVVRYLFLLATPRVLSSRKYAVEQSHLFNNDGAGLQFFLTKFRQSAGG